VLSLWLTPYTRAPSGLHPGNHTGRGTAFFFLFLSCPFRGRFAALGCPGLLCVSWPNVWHHCRPSHLFFRLVQVGLKEGPFSTAPGPVGRFMALFFFFSTVQVELALRSQSTLERPCAPPPFWCSYLHVPLPFLCVGRAEGARASEVRLSSCFLQVVEGAVLKRKELLVSDLETPRKNGRLVRNVFPNDHSPFSVSWTPLVFPGVVGFRARGRAASNFSLCACLNLCCTRFPGMARSGFPVLPFFAFQIGVQSLSLLQALFFLLKSG